MRVGKLVRRLHIGGTTKADGWEVLNANSAPYVDHVCNANDLSQFSDNTFSEIYASHIVEHLDYHLELVNTLKEWNRVLVEGGKIFISVPDLDVLAGLILEKNSLTVDERFLVMRMIFGGHVDKYDYHVVGLNEAFLTDFLNATGYVNIRTVDAFNLFHDTSSMLFKGVAISLNMIAEKHGISKPNDGALPQTNPLDEWEIYKKRGNEFLAKGMLEDAAACYRQAVVINPNYAEGFLNLGFVTKELKLYEEAERCLNQAISINPEMEDAYYILGVLSQEHGNLDGAIENYNKTLELKPDFKIVYSDFCHVLLQCSQHERAKQVIQQGISIYPESVEFYFFLGNLLVDEKEWVQATTCYQKLLSIQSDNDEVLCRLGNIFRAQGDLEEAQVYYNKALARNPDNPDAHNNLGAVFQDHGNLDKAEACYRKAFALRTDFAEAYSNLGNIFTAKANPEEAITYYQQALVLKPDSAEVYNNLAVAFKNNKNLNESVVYYRKALALKPDFPDAYNNLAAALIDQGELGEAISCYQQALLLKPAFFAIHTNLGIVYQRQGKYDQAIACYRQALECDPALHETRMNLVHLLQHTCEWTNAESLSDEVRRAVREVSSASTRRIAPFGFLALSHSTPQEQKICASNWMQDICQPLMPVKKQMQFEFKRESKRKINLAYLSADFREHAVAHLMAQIFELHDRKRFRISAYSYGVNDSSRMRTRLENAFDEFVDMRNLSDENAAKKIYDNDIDILVDLTGHTRDSRSAILFLRPAPIQVNFLGFPGTLGADFVDYLIADQFIIPLEQQGNYAEKVVYLPDCYMPRDMSCSRLAEPSRTSCGLPEEGFVFCSFNQAYKITPEIFDVWCRLLRTVPGSVLWLSHSPYAESNLRREAESRGVAWERVIMAPRTKLAEEHLARLQCADLFLDTTPYNAHTTCSDALWMGLPVVTCVGETFSSRVAGSLLTALGVPELITYNLDDYYAVALELASNKGKYEHIRNKILANRDSAPLFDSKKFTRNLEKVYLQMWDDYVRATDDQICPH